MPMTKEQILAEAMQLSESDRDDLADRLWRSVDRANGTTVDEAWAQEAERRIDGIDRGERKTIPGDQVMEEVRLKLQQMRK